MATTTRALLTVAIVAAALPATVPAAEAKAAAVRCAGRAATIVSSAREVVGTPGPDVIVVRSRRAGVDAGAGDDRICVRGRRGFTMVDPGPGDDRVQVESRTFTYAALGAGRDTYRGGPGGDRVGTGSRRAVNRDRVDLAGGDDAVFLAPGADHRRAEVVGGEGRDEVSVLVRSGTLELSASAERAVHRGATYARWQSMERHVMYSAGRQVFLGTEGDDDVSFGGSGAVTATTLGGDDTARLSVEGDSSELREAPRARGVLPRPRTRNHIPTTRARGVLPTLRGRGSSSTTAHDITVDLGPGRDELDVSVGPWDRVVHADLTRGQVELSDGTEATGAFGFSGVEDLAVDAGSRSPKMPSRVVLVGDDQDNTLRGAACHVEVHGNGGDDHLRVGLPLPQAVILFAGQAEKTCRRTSALHGGVGDDVLVSRVVEFDLGPPEVEVGEKLRTREVPVRDLLDGGEGHDSADAGDGTDTCLAEVRAACEA